MGVSTDRGTLLVAFAHYADGLAHVSEDRWSHGLPGSSGDLCPIHYVATHRHGVTTQIHEPPSPLPAHPNPSAPAHLPRPPPYPDDRRPSSPFLRFPVFATRLRAVSVCVTSRCSWPACAPVFPSPGFVDTATDTHGSPKPLMYSAYVLRRTRQCINDSITGNDRGEGGERGFWSSSRRGCSHPRAWRMVLDDSAFRRITGCDRPRRSVLSSCWIGRSSTRHARRYTYSEAPICK